MTAANSIDGAIPTTGAPPGGSIPAMAKRGAHKTVDAGAIAPDGARMGGPAHTSPRLGELDANFLAVDVYEIVVRKARELGELLGMESVDVPMLPLKARVASLVAWTRTGDPGERDEALAALAAIARALYLRTVDNHGEVTSCGRCQASLFDIDTRIGVLLAGAQARAAIEAQRPISPMQLAALAGVAKSLVKQLLAAGKIERDANGAVLASAARAWLAARGVPGL